LASGTLVIHGEVHDLACLPNANRLRILAANVEDRPRTGELGERAARVATDLRDLLVAEGDAIAPVPGCYRIGDIMRSQVRICQRLREDFLCRGAHVHLNIQDGLADERPTLIEHHSFGLCGPDVHARYIPH
jgi:hypothetical protein